METGGSPWAVSATVSATPTRISTSEHTDTPNCPISFAGPDGLRSRPAAAASCAYAIWPDRSGGDAATGADQCPRAGGGGLGPTSLQGSRMEPLGTKDQPT